MYGRMSLGRSVLRMTQWRAETRGGGGRGGC